MWCAVAVLGWTVAAPPVAPTAREALQPFNVLVGAWKGTGYPEGTREERAAGFWSEGVAWGWKFKGDDAWLEAAFTKGKYFQKAELRWAADKQAFRLVLTTVDGATQAFAGALKDKVLTLDREGAPAGGEDQRLVVSLLHHNRHLYWVEARPAGTAQRFAKKYQVGATKEGAPFAEVAKGPECIVSGGVGTSKVSYKGKDYYVCCSGCRDEFKADPEKYLKEAEKRANQKKE